MNGTALYQGVATIFLAQILGVDLSVGVLLLVMVLEPAGIPPAGIVLIMGIDRVLDMARTAVNVCGDLVTATLMNRWMVNTDLIEDASAEAVTET